MNCSKCTKPAARAIVVYDAKDPIPDPGSPDPRSVKIIRFCAGHWVEVQELLPI